MIYLASPYSHEDASVREDRYRQVCLAAAMLKQQGSVVFSPIAHSHGIALCLSSDESKDFAYWSKFDLAILGMCNVLMVLTLLGWDSSVGIRAEIAEARRLGIPVYHLSPPK